MTGYWQRKWAMFVQADATTLGPTEYIPALKARNYAGIILNVATGDWPDERKLAAEHGLDVVPWLRCRTLADLTRLDRARAHWCSAGIVPDLEIEDTRDAKLMAAALKTMSLAGHGLVSTDAWADPIGRWQGYRKWSGSPQCFPEQNTVYEDVSGCVLHACAFFHYVLPTLGAYGTKWKGRLPIRLDYNWPIASPWIVYPGDAVPDWSHW